MSEQVGRPLRRMLWHRLPVYFPNIKLIMEKPDKATYRRARWQGYLARATFRTTPEVTKLEVREFLEKVYGAPVLRVDTVIVQGALRKWSDQGNRPPVTVKASDYKKVFVRFAKGSVAAVAESAAKGRTLPRATPSTLSTLL